MLGCSICYIPVLGFQPGVRRERVYDRKQFPSAVSRYLVSNRANARGCSAAARWFPSAISRYLVSDLVAADGPLPPSTGFYPLYRGTWFPTDSGKDPPIKLGGVSIRYIAVLGFQPAGIQGQFYSGFLFPSAISRYLVSNN